MTIYIAGPMTGYPEFNYPKFKAVAAELRAGGLDVRSPADDEPPNAYTTDQPYGFYLRRSLRILLDCDEIVLLPGWQDSLGARIEHDIAQALGMTITEWMR